LPHDRGHVSALPLDRGDPHRAAQSLQLVYDNLRHPAADISGMMHVSPEWRSTMVRNARMQLAAVLAAGALLGCLAASGRQNLSLRADAGPSPAEAASEKPIESPGDARPACCDEVNEGLVLAQANGVAPGGAAPQPPTQPAPAQKAAEAPADKRPRNMIFVICDQETHHLTASKDYKLPARQALMRHGVTFQNHYIASAMCTASRAAFLTGQPPQVTGVFDQMQYT
jgi:hypothetical protein